MNQPTVNRKKVLLVEDDFYIRELYEREFKKDGYEVYLAVDGAEGFLKLSELKPDLLLLDLMIPKLNGLELLTKMKQDPVLKNIKVIVLSNLGQDEAIKKAFGLGADGYLVKAAYTPAQVVKEVENYLK